MKIFKLFLILFLLSGCDVTVDEQPPMIVFVTGDEEYRSEESMPMLAHLLHHRHGFDVKVVYAITDNIIDPNRTDNIEGLEILADADMMVLYTRFRNLPDDQLQYILDFAESGKPMAGFRTSTHAFQYGEEHPNHYLDFEWPQNVFGLPWISHHGSANSTEVSIAENREGHPILRGVEAFHARSWLYHSDTLLDSAQPLLTGRAVEGTEPDGEYFGEPHVVAWTHRYRGEHGESRIFFTTLGHPYDFFDENMRRLSVQGIFWALGMENSIPDQGLNVDFTMEYDPNPAGFGQQFKQGLKPLPTIRHIFGLYVEIIPSVIGTYQKFGIPLLDEYGYSLELEDGLLKESSMSQVETLELSNF